jgi:hypothetical protein
MQIPVITLRRLCSLAVLAALAGLATGCATNSRYILLKEYGPTGAALSEQPLQGKTICLKGFQTAPDLTSPSPQTKPEQPQDFKFVEFTDEQSETWDREFRELKKRTPKEQCRRIGHLRNMLGIEMSHIYALNDPSAWLVETLKLDLERQGAKVVEAAQCDTADLSVSGTIQFCRVDIYMKIWGDLVVDLELQPKNRPPARTTLHTEGGTVAWVGATSEFYKPLRESRQKFSWLLTREITKALGQ